MPRANTPEEARRIRTALLEVGRARFAEHGLGGVKVQDLTDDVGIGKGSFYLFHGSKEALFFEIQVGIEAEFRRELVRALASLQAEPIRLIERFITLHLNALDTHPFLRHLADPTVLASLQAKLPAAVLQAHQEQDQAFYIDLVQGWMERGVLPSTTDPQLFFAVLAGSYALALNREVVGERWQDVAGLMARGLARELLSGSHDDPDPR